MPVSTQSLFVFGIGFWVIVICSSLPLEAVKLKSIDARSGYAVPRFFSGIPEWAALVVCAKPCVFGFPGRAFSRNRRPGPPDPQARHWNRPPHSKLAQHTHFRHNPGITILFSEVRRRPYSLDRYVGNPPNIQCLFVHFTLMSGRVGKDSEYIGGQTFRKWVIQLITSSVVAVLYKLGMLVCIYIGQE